METIEKTPEELAEIEKRRVEYRAEQKRKWDEYQDKLDALHHEMDVREPEKPFPAWSMPFIEKFYKNNPYMAFEVKQGEFFLFQKFESHKGDVLMSRPVLAMCVEFDVYDQAGVIRYIEFSRTWQTNILKHTPTARVEETVLWDTSMYVFKKWVGKPSWKELLTAYRTTFYYGQPERVNTINEILRDLDETTKKPD